MADLVGAMIGSSGAILSVDERFLCRDSGMQELNRCYMTDRSVGNNKTCSVLRIFDNRITTKGDVGCPYSGTRI